MRSVTSRRGLAVLLGLSACTIQPAPTSRVAGDLQRSHAIAPQVDHHQHLLSPEGAVLVNSLFDLDEKPVDGSAMVKLLDDAGIQRAVIVSNAYYFDAPQTDQRPASYEAMRRENDWTALQASRFPTRLIAFCSVNPLKDYAKAEVERCASQPIFKGLKLHFDTSGVDLLNPEHVLRTKQVFSVAAAHGLPIHVHAARKSTPPYGAAHANIFVAELLPAAATVPVIMGHLWGGGDYSAEALATYSDAVSLKDPRAQNLYFEVAQATSGGRTEAELQDMAERIRQIGLLRVFFGSDGPQFGGVAPAEAWSEFRRLMPLTDHEFRTIAENIAPGLNS